MKFLRKRDAEAYLKSVYFDFYGNDIKECEIRNFKIISSKASELAINEELRLEKRANRNRKRRKQSDLQKVEMKKYCIKSSEEENKKKYEVCSVTASNG